MLAKRIVPTLLVKGRQLYKGVSFKASERSIGHAAQAVRVHAARGVDELVLLDITATAEGRGPDLGLVRELSEELFIPLTVGGGVRSLTDIDALLRAGADKVSICTGLHEVPDLLPDAAARFGSQAIVACIEVRLLSKRQEVTFKNGGRRVSYVATGNDKLISLSQPAMAAVMFAEEGAGEILLTSVDRDGTLEGYDLDLIREVSAAVSIPVIASGGAGTYEHLLEGIRAGADAVAAGAMFAFTDATPRGAAQFLRRNGICVRL